MRGFQLAAVGVGAGELGLCPLPGRGGDFAGDLDAVLRWGPRLILTMTTAAELDSAGASELGATLEARGVAWHHLPIEDFGAPRGETLRLWPEAANAAREVLEAGGRVLVHCHGGCGRSGMAVLRLMIEAGEAPEAALLRLRAVRPCAVETEAQMAWATRP